MSEEGEGQKKEIKDVIAELIAEVKHQEHFGKELAFYSTIKEVMTLVTHFTGSVLACEEVDNQEMREQYLQAIGDLVVNCFEPMKHSGRHYPLGALHPEDKDKLKEKAT